MSDALHCNCDVDDTRLEYFFHLPNCLVGAVLTVAHALTIEEGNDTEGMGAVEILGVAVREGLMDITNAVSEGH